MEQRIARGKSKGSDVIKMLRPDVPVEREKDLHEFIFSDARSRGWIVLHGAMSERTARTPGEFDFILIATGGRTFFIECKTRKGKLSPQQLAMKVHAEMLGHKPAVVRSVKEYLSIVSPSKI